MNEEIISEIIIKHFSRPPGRVERCSVGIGNYVYIAHFADAEYVVRCSSESGAYDDTVYWLEKLSSIDVPVPRVLARGTFSQYEYIILSYIPGKDLGLVYPDLSAAEKRKIAKDVAAIQSRVAALTPDNIDPFWSWETFVYGMLDRAEELIAANGWFSTERVERLRAAAKKLHTYFLSVKPTAYLDDISTKNLLISGGEISGIIDIDWIGVGDRLTFAALTKMALLNLGCDTDYVSYILEQLRPSDEEKKAFDFYTLMYCVDFMGERGMTFLGRTIEVSEEIIERLNSIYDTLWDDFAALL